MLFRFVRREKEIAVAQSEASEGEALRYKQQVEHKDRELKELQEALNAERERMQVRDCRPLTNAEMPFMTSKAGIDSNDKCLVV